MGTKETKINALVTGGGGFVGMAILRRLIAQGFNVATFSRKLYPEHQKLGVQIFQGNISNIEALNKATKNIDVVFHTAAKVGIWGSYEQFFETNTKGTENLIKACRKNGVKKLIFTSSASVVFNGTDLENVDEKVDYPQNSVSHYTHTKALAEKLVLNANDNTLRTISLRPHLVWGPGDTQLIPKILERAKAGRMRRIGKKKFLMDHTYIDNLVDAQILAMEKLGLQPDISQKAFFITNGAPIPIWDFLNGIIEAHGMRAVEKTTSKITALTIAYMLEIIYSCFKSKKAPFITSFLVRELSTHHWFNISAARQLLDYVPAIDFNTGLKNLTQNQQ